MTTSQITDNIRACLSTAWRACECVPQSVSVSVCAFLRPSVHTSVCAVPPYVDTCVCLTLHSSSADKQPPFRLRSGTGPTVHMEQLTHIR